MAFSFANIFGGGDTPATPPVIQGPLPAPDTSAPAAPVAVRGVGTPEHPFGDPALETNPARAANIRQQEAQLEVFKNYAADNLNPKQYDAIVSQYVQGINEQDTAMRDAAINAVNKVAAVSDKRANKTSLLSPEMIAAMPELQKYANVPMTDSQMQAITQAYLTNSLKDPKEQKFQVDRSQLPGYLRNAPEGAINKYYEDLIANQQAGQDTSDYWPRLKGKSLQIVNNDEFKRSGLKTGDTVCIKIP